jgi:hypothetical protein
MSLISGSYSREVVAMAGAPESLEKEVEKLLREAGAEATAKPDEAKRLAPTEAEQRPLAARGWTRSFDADLRLREMADIVKPKRGERGERRV